MGFYYFNYTYFAFMLPAIIVSVIAQILVHSTFRKYSRIPVRSFLTGEGAALRVLQFGGVSDVRVFATGGSLTDHFNPSTKTIALSEPVYAQSTISAVGVAAHEAGHAIQYANSYAPIKIRNALVPVVNFGSRLAMPVMVLGLLLPYQYGFVVYIGMALYGLALLFSLVTLPVEFNASAWAIRVLRESGTLAEEELHGAKKVLRAAAMTYVAATITSLLSFLYLLSVANSRRGNQ